MITSKQNQRIVQLSKLHQKKYRDQAGQFLVAGEHLVNEACRALCCDELFVTQAHDFPYDGLTTVVSQDVIDKLANVLSPVKAVALCHLPTVVVNNPQRILLCEQVQDPGNVGTLIRSAYGFGFDMVFTSMGCADITNDKTIRSTQGAIFNIPVVTGDALPWVKEKKNAGYLIVATTLDMAADLANVIPTVPVVIMVGHEGQGLSQSLLEQADVKVTIPMAQFDSLNVAVAGGILCYHWRKQ